jgi:CheY-like chemotaxis protein
MTKALVLQKNPINMELVIEILAALGFIAHGTSDANEVIKMMEKEFYDLIIIDIELFGLDCTQLPKIIRSKPSYNNAAIVAMTTNEMPREKERFLASGYDDYIPIPINVSEFMKRMEKYKNPPKK